MNVTLGIYLLRSPSRKFLTKQLHSNAVLSRETKLGKQHAISNCLLTTTYSHSARPNATYERPRNVGAGPEPRTWASSKCLWPQ